MEVLSARMAPVFKGEDNWKYKRVFENKHARQTETKMEQRSDRALNYEATMLRESGHKKPYVGEATVWEGSGRHPAAARSGVRMNADGGSTSNGYTRKPEVLEESSDEPETSQDIRADESENSGDDEQAPATPAAETPQKWPIIQIVDPPAWLPEGWTAVLRTRESGSKDKYYVDPVSQRRFRSKTEVNYYLQTGKSYRYKRNLALLTKPLKEDPVSLPNTIMRNVSADMPNARESTQVAPFMSPSPYAGDHRSVGAVPSRSGQMPDLRLSTLTPQGDQLPRKPYNKPGPKPKVRTLSDDQGRMFPANVSKRNVSDDRKGPESSPGQVNENRGKLILKLKRKTSELDEGQKNGKKPRPFEVVGVTPVMQAKSRSTTSDEDERYQKNPWGVDHAAETTSRLVPRSIVPSNHVSRRPISKAPPLPPWQYQGQSSALNRAQFGGSGSNGQGHVLERASGSATLSVMDSENAKLPQKRESPAEQLQRLGKKLCQQAVLVLSSDYGGCNTLQQISWGLHSAMNPYNTGFNGQLSSTYNHLLSTGFHGPVLTNINSPLRGCGVVAGSRTRVAVQCTNLNWISTMPLSLTLSEYIF